MNANLIEPLRLLDQKTQQAWSGCIAIEQPRDTSVGWQIYLLEGKIQYANSTLGKQERFNYLCQQLQLGSDYPKIDLEQEYEQLCQWYSLRSSPNLDLKQVLFKLNQEALIQILSIDQVSAEFREDNYLPESVASFDLQELVYTPKINSWKKVKNYIFSPFARIHLNEKNFFSFYKLWKKLCENPQFAKFANYHKISNLSQQLNQKSCCYQLASRLNTEILMLATHLKPFIEENLIEILPFEQQKIQSKPELAPAKPEKYVSRNQSKPESNNIQAAKVSTASSLLIACIDDSKTVQTQVTRTLEAMDYQVINILDPTTALKALYKQKPALILLDINMPAMNGYDLCSMLRRSSKFESVPIVMLTGRDGIIDRMRAKFVGSTDYLTKPFEPNTLISLVQKLALPVGSV